MAKQEKGEVIKLRDKVEVVSTEKDPYHVTGSTFKVHPKVAEKLYKNGLATEVGKAAKSK